jgi:hypothetical protein
MTPANGTVKFSTNIPEIVSLAFAEGRPVESQYSGDQVMFSLTDGRKMYLAPFVADRIREAGIGANQPFEICKREVSHGNRRTVEFQIRPVQGGRSPVQHSPAPAVTLPQLPRQNSAPDLTETLEQSIARAQAARGATSVPTPAAAGSSVAKMLGDLFTECGIQAIDAILKLERYANERGLTDFAFGADAIERIAVHISIGAQQRSSR